MDDLEKRVGEAIKHFWLTRKDQADRQGAASGKKDQGSRSAVTGGKQIDGFISLMGAVLEESGIPPKSIFWKKRNITLPGYFRPTKEWDLVAVVAGELLASVEFKSQVGSFGNNFNNRTEEAIGNATDFLAAYREGAFEKSGKPWVGYFMLLENATGSTTSVGVREPHFRVFPEFYDSSYTDRYRIFCQKLVRERLYDAACLITSDARSGLSGQYTEPLEEIGFRKFATSLMAHAVAFVKMGKK